MFYRDQELYFSEDELKSFIKEQHGLRIEYAFHEYIEYLRLINKQYFEGISTHEGNSILMFKLIEGSLSSENYIKLKEVINNPNVKYTLNVKDK